MNQITTIVLPVFGLIAIGYGVSRLHILDSKRSEGLSEFVFVIAIPLLILRVIVTADFSGTSAWRLWLPYFGALAICWVAGTLVMRRLFGRDERTGLVGGVAAVYGNTTLAGIPLVLAAFGNAGSVPMALIIAVQFPIVMTVVALFMARMEGAAGDAGGRGAAVLRNLVRTLARNPIIIGLAAGAVWRFSGVPYAGLPAVLIGRLADLTSTLALFAMGMSLSRYGVHGHVRVALVLSVIKLLVMPALVLAFALAVGLPALATKVAVIAAACPTGVTPYLVAGRLGTGEGLASNVLTISTVIAVVTISFWLHAVQWL